MSLEEEVKNIDNEFTQAILKESGNFLLALKNLEIVQVTDISQLVRMKTVHMQEIESMGKVSDHFKTMFKDMLVKMDDQIAILEKQIVDNKLITGQILIQVKALFAESLAKLISNTPLGGKLTLKEIEVKAPGRVGDGNWYEHPPKDKLDFKNPINKVFHISSSPSHCRFYFGNKNGDVGVIQQTAYDFVAVPI